MWSLANLTRLHEVFVATPDEGDRSFVDKFRDQVKPAGQAVVRLAAETLCIYFLFPSNVGGYRKRDLVNEVLSMGTLKPDAVLDHGTPRAVVDAKYKRLAPRPSAPHGPVREDLYQIASYLARCGKGLPRIPGGSGLPAGPRGLRSHAG